MLNPRSIPKIARWAAAAAILTVLAVVANFAYLERRASKSMLKVPAAVPSSVEQRSVKFTFSKVEGQQTVFTIRAARATQFSRDKQSLLEDVDIIVHGEHGERHDEIRTHSCDYEPSTGGIVCHGEVRLDLASAPVPGRPAAESAGGIHIEARGVGFNRDTGEALSDAPVEFRFPQGKGSAVGVRYSSREEGLTLTRDVALTLAPDRPGGLPTHVSAKGGLQYDRGSGKLLLRGPVEISTGGRSLETAALTVDLEDEMRPRRAVAGGQATVRIAEGSRSGSFEADSIAIGFDAQGRAGQLDADGHVMANQEAPSAMRLAAERLSVALDPLSQQPRTVDATGAVRLSAGSGDSSERLATDSLHLTAVPVAAAAAESQRSGHGAAAKTEAVRLDRATTGGPARVDWRSGSQSLRLDAKRLSAAFDAGSRIRELHGSDGVRLERRQAGQEPVVTEANALVAHFAEGEWSDAEESGNVRAVQGTRTASAESARWSRAENSLDLSGEARAGDPTGQTLADEIVWDQQSGMFRASGNVRSTYFAKAGGETGVAPSAGPASVVAARLVANPSAGEATYSGGARLWQGDLAIQADRIDLRRAQGELVAQGNVLAAFPQAPREMGKPGRAGASARNAPPSGPVLWRVRAKRLTYVSGTGAAAKAAAKSGQGEAVVDGGVEAWSSQGKINAEKLVLTLQRDNTGRAELAQATASGGVNIRQGERWGQAERALYLAAPGKFVLTGGHPSLHDTSGDLVRGDQLTFYVADDTILVESSKGSRTLTRHPIPN